MTRHQALALQPGDEVRLKRSKQQMTVSHTEQWGTEKRFTIVHGTLETGRLVAYRPRDLEFVEQAGSGIAPHDDSADH